MDETPSAAIVDINPVITSILSHDETLIPLRRTLSANTDPLPPRGPDHLSRFEEEQEEGSRFEIWNLIQEDRNKKKKKKKNEVWDRRLGEFNVWSSMVLQNRSQWSEPETLHPPPYVHPLVRRSSSCLSEKSLEICTESLGSESGSDGFSPFLLSETESVYSSNEQEGRKEAFPSAAFRRTDVEHDFCDKPLLHARAAIPRNKDRPRSFPPPLRSLSSAADGSSVRMRSLRENGRLVLEAVSVPYQKYFQARRENGRLMLAFTAPDFDYCDRDVVHDQSTEEHEVADKVECGYDGGIKWIISKKTTSTVEISASSPNINRIGKLKIPKIAIVINIDELPPIARTRAAANPPNMYEYFWRTNPREATALAVTNPSETTQPLRSYHDTKKHHVISRSGHDSFGRNNQRKLQILFKDYTNKNMEDCWVSVMKDSRRSLFFFEPHCIATS